MFPDLNPFHWFSDDEEQAPAPQQQPSHDAGHPAHGGGGGATEVAQATGPEATSIRERFRQQAFAQIGVSSAEEFEQMDPRQRNTLITGAYADMYMSDPDSMKWAGMASYASDLVGVGIAGTQAANAPLPIGPGLVPNPMQGPSIGDGINGAVDTELLQQRLAEGNAGIYDDLMWQHMAMQSGGIDMIREAAEAGEIPAEQLEGWERIAEGRRRLDAARESGNEAAISAAQEEIWQGNGSLLHYEQNTFAAENVYEADPETRELFRTISPAMVSPIPGGESFANFRDRTGAEGDIDIGDREQRVAWSTGAMLSEYRERETGNNDAMMRDMRRFSANADTGLPGLPVNTEDPADFQLPEVPDLPYVPRIMEAIEDAGIGRPLMPDLPSMEDVTRHLPWAD